MVSASQRRVRITIVTTGTIFALFSLLFPGWARMRFKRDHNAAPPQQAVVTVAQVVPPSSNPFSGQPEPPLVRVDFQGQAREVSVIRGVNQLHAGAKARIVYRIGQSGRIYIDSVEPLTAAPTPIK